MRMQVQSLAILSGLRIRRPKLWGRSQVQLRSYAAVAMVSVSNCSSDSTPSLGTSIFCRCSPKMKKKKETKNKIQCLGFAQREGILFRYGSLHKNIKNGPES